LVWRADLRQHADELHAPPLGFALFYLRGIAPPTIKTSQISWGAIPWVGLQVILVVIVIFWPGSGRVLAGVGDLLARAAGRRRPVEDQDRANQYAAPRSGSPQN